LASQKRIDMWNALLDAEMNEVYWHREAQRYTTQDRFIAVAAAILSSSTVVALFSGVSASPIISRAVACLAGAVAISHAKFFHSARLKQLTTIATRWKEMAIEYQLLWSELDSNCEVDAKTWREYEAISRREKNIDESAFKIHDGRLKEAQARIYEARGLKDEQRQ
jgi:hypothetical protein